MNRCRLLLSILMALSGCIINVLDDRDVPHVTARAQGLVARIEAMSEFSPIMALKSIRVTFSLKNESTRTFLISRDDLTLIDVEGFSVGPEDAHWFNVESPNEVRRFAEFAVRPGSEVQVRASFPQRVDFDRLSAIRIRSYTGGMTVEIPLTQSGR